jgi:hypothetical protein
MCTRTTLGELVRHAFNTIIAEIIPTSSSLQVRILMDEMSLYLPNRAGEFNRSVRALAEAQVNIVAFSIDQSGPYNIIRLVCDKPQIAKEQLEKYAVGVSNAKVLAIPLPHEPGRLHRVVELLANQKINIEYGYQAPRPGSTEAIVFFKTNDNNRARQLLLDNQLEDLDSITEASASE